MTDWKFGNLVRVDNTETDSIFMVIGPYTDKRLLNDSIETAYWIINVDDNENPDNIFGGPPMWCVEKDLIPYD